MEEVSLLARRMLGSARNMPVERNEAEERLARIEKLLEDLRKRTDEISAEMRVTAPPV